MLPPCVHTARVVGTALPYYVARNARGNLPVYTDVRNAGSRYHVLLRNVDGSPHALARDLADSLFPQGSEEGARLKIEVVRNSTLVLTGGRWRHHVVEWLHQRGF